MNDTVETSEEPTRHFKTAVYEQLARIGKALASGPRIELLELLSQVSCTVDELAGKTDQSIANTSHHLQVLRRARLVDSEREGVYVRYALADNSVAALIRALRTLAEDRLLELDSVMKAFLDQRAATEPVDREQLVARVRDGQVTVLDVRPYAEFRAGHLPDAISIPLAELEDRIAELPSKRPVVAYCRGRYCVMALDAVALLRSRGVEAEHLDEGVADWRARGLTVVAAG